jgi:lactoylglutathione lyase
MKQRQYLIMEEGLAMKFARTILLGVACLWSTCGWTDHLGVVGIGVKDLQVSKQFYADVLGLEVLRTYELGYINEIVMGYPDGKGAAVVLMNWPGDTTRQYNGNDVKLVFDVADPAAVAARIRAHGGRIDREAGPVDALPGAIVAMGRDPDNYVIELLKRK